MERGTGAPAPHPASSAQAWIELRILLRWEVTWGSLGQAALQAGRWRVGTWSQQEAPGRCPAITHPRDVTAEEGLVVMLSLDPFLGPACLPWGWAWPQKRMDMGGCIPYPHPPLLQAQPTDMRALQDFEEPDKLHIQMNDIITVIEGRYCMGGWQVL